MEPNPCEVSQDAHTNKNGIDIDSTGVKYSYECYIQIIINTIPVSGCYWRP